MESRESRSNVGCVEKVFPVLRHNQGGHRVVRGLVEVASDTTYSEACGQRVRRIGERGRPLPDLIFRGGILHRSYTVGARASSGPTVPLGIQFSGASGLVIRDHRKFISF